MEALIEWARGPAFIFSLTFMVLGLARHLLLTLWESARVIRRAGDRDIPYKQVFQATAKWLFPLDKLRHEVVFSVTSVVFHAAILVVPVLLAGHIKLLAATLGFSWPALPGVAADALTIVAVVTAIAIVIQRGTARATRQLSRIQDYLLPLIVALPFASGFLVMHPTWSPVSFELMLFVHVMSANLVLVLMPLTKLSHAVMLPSVQLVSELGWRWPVDSGSAVGVALGKESDPV